MEAARASCDIGASGAENFPKAASDYRPAVQQGAQPFKQALEPSSLPGSRLALETFWDV